MFSVIFFPGYGPKFPSLAAEWNFIDCLVEFAIGRDFRCMFLGLATQ